MTPGEYLEANRIAIGHRLVALVLPAAGFALAVVGTVAGARAGDIIAGCTLLAASCWLWGGAAWMRLRRDPAQAGPFLYRFDDAGITITSPAGEVALPWARVRKVTIGSRLVVLKAGTSGVAFPRRAVAAGDWDRLESLLSQRTAAPAD